MCIPDLTASWFLPLYSKSKHRTIIFLLIDWFGKGLIFLHKCPLNLGIWDGLWRFNFNCKPHSKHFCVVLEKRMRNESHNKDIGQAKERGGGEEERKTTPSPPPSPPSFFGSSSIFCATETENPIPRLSLVFLHSETTLKCLLTRLLQLLWTYPLLSTQSFC